MKSEDSKSRHPTVDEAGFSPAPGILARLLRTKQSRNIGDFLRFHNILSASISLEICVLLDLVLNECTGSQSVDSLKFLKHG